MLGTEDVDLAARGDEGAMRRLLTSLIDANNNFATQMGYDPAASPSADPTQNISPPQQPAINVSAEDGHVKIVLTNPPNGYSNVAGTYRVEPAFGFAGVVLDGTLMQVQQSTSPYLTPLDDSSTVRRVFHQLESSLTLNFDADGDVRIYGPSAALSYDITDPGVSRYWRVKSRFENSEFSDYVYFVNAATCGPVSVWAGLLRTSSSDWLNSAATTKTGTSPLSQNGVTTDILVDASQWDVGTQEIDYNPGHVDPGAFGAYTVYGIDVEKKGGDIEFNATLDPSDLTNRDGIVYFGFITTAGGGGGTGAGGGGGYDPGDGCCIGEVPITMFDGSEKPHSECRVGDEVEGVDGGLDIIVRISVSIQPCFRLEFDNGKVIEGASSTQRLMYDGGGFDKVFELIETNRFQSKTGPAHLVTKTFIGFRLVYNISLSRSKTMWLAGMAAHNSMKPF